MKNTITINTLKTNAINDIIDILNNMDCNDIVDIAENYTGDDIYTDIDDALNGYSPRDIIEIAQNGDIDLYATFYRNSYGDIDCYDDIDDLFNTTEFANDCIDNDNDYDNDDIRNVLDELASDIDDLKLSALHDLVDTLKDIDELKIEQIKGAIIAIVNGDFSNY